MDLFEDFSFSRPAHSFQHNVIHEIEPTHDISPRSSREVSPFSTSSSMHSPYHSLMDLSHSYEPLPALDHDVYSSSTYPATPISSRLLGLDRRRSTAREFFDGVRQRRQSAVRLQCDPRNAASIRNYVERFINDEARSGSSRHPSSTSQGYIAPPTSAPMQDLKSSFTDSSSDEDEAEAFKTLSISDRPGGSDRPVSGSVSSGRRRSYAVQKSAKARLKPSGR
ncbi:MAG: hypothetical protein LQ340_002551 [Diploschistes diacapsis]|nr:MAG: hypothetical protein LQ340_002551 [Diploschistes diacapsis]